MASNCSLGTWIVVGQAQPHCLIPETYNKIDCLGRTHGVEAYTADQPSSYVPDCGEGFEQPQKRSRDQVQAHRRK